MTKRFKFICDDENCFFKDGNKALYCYEVVDILNSLSDENEELKKEIVKFKEWEKHIGDVKRVDLDKVFKMSIYEIAEAFKCYQERIKEMKND